MLRTIISAMIALPLLVADEYTSEQIPPARVYGADTHRPAKNLNTSRADHEGASAHPIVETVYAAKVDIRIILLPYISLRGLKAIGPNM